MVHLSDGVSAVAPWKLRTEELGVRYRRHWLIHGLTWGHRPGRIAWVVGSNGAGKSSLLRVLAGRERPAAGRVERSGPPGADTDRVLFYHPDMRLPTGATVGDWHRMRAALEEHDDLRPLDVRLDPDLPPARPLERLSTGEAKRLLLDALLRRDRPFIFLDEPYEHLSSDAREDLTAALVLRARRAVVVVATNQPVPDGAEGPVLHLGPGRSVSLDPVNNASARP